MYLYQSISQQQADWQKLYLSCICVAIVFVFVPAVNQSADGKIWTKRGPMSINANHQMSTRSLFIISSCSKTLLIQSFLRRIRRTCLKLILNATYNDWLFSIKRFCTLDTKLYLTTEKAVAVCVFVLKYKILIFCSRTGKLEELYPSSTLGAD